MKRNKILAISSSNEDLREFFSENAVVADASVDDRTDKLCLIRRRLNGAYAHFSLHWPDTAFNAEVGSRMPLFERGALRELSFLTVLSDIRRSGYRVE